MTDPVLHSEFYDAIQAGDARLRDHIDQSIARLAASVAAGDLQVSLALESAEKLERERVHRLEQRLDVASEERAKAAEVLRDELHRTAEAAAEEREKSAAAVRATLELQIDALKREFMGIIIAKSELFQIIHDEAEKAAEKTERFNETWREQTREWREQSTIREQIRAQEMAALTATFLPREVGDSQFKQLEQRLRALESNRTSQEGASRAVERKEDRTQPWMLGLVSLVGGGLLGAIVTRL